MIESAKNCLSQMIAPAAVQENSSWWKTSIDLWSQDSRAHLLSLKNLKLSCSENVLNDFRYFSKFRASYLNITVI